jgi:hypothetical protein
VGVDDVGRIDAAGRPMTFGVEPWLDELVAAKRLVELALFRLRPLPVNKQVLERGSDLTAFEERRP